MRERKIPHMRALRLIRLIFGKKLDPRISPQTHHKHTVPTPSFSAIQSLYLHHTTKSGTITNIIIPMPHNGKDLSIHVTCRYTRKVHTIKKLTTPPSYMTPLATTYAQLSFKKDCEQTYYSKTRLLS